MNAEALRYGMKVVHTVDGSRCEVRGLTLAENAPPSVQLEVEGDELRCDCGCEHCCPWPAPLRSVPIDEIEPV